MQEVIEVNKQFYILATSPRVDENFRVLKQGETFAVFDHFGNIQPIGLGEEGLFHRGTRYLNRFVVRLNGQPPLLLSSTVREDNLLFTVDLTNPDIRDQQQVTLPRDTIHVVRSSFLWDGTCYMRFRLHNFSLKPVDFSLSVLFDADFADIFEVRGARRNRRGELLAPRVEAATVTLGYRGLDDLPRTTRLEFHPEPTRLGDKQADFAGVLSPGEEQTHYVSIHCDPQGPRGDNSFTRALAQATERLSASRGDDAVIYTSNELFNDWIHRSAADLHMMVTLTEQGPYPYAGVPWFSTAFGRDGIITALQYLLMNPSFARGVLAYLAATQSDELNDERDAEPGKILHETRQGEMANLGEIPFGRYYGSVDATPLFLMLAGAYYRRTADRPFIVQLWPHIERALAWIERYADSDGDGFYDYARRSPKGLVTQGWKDSIDSIFHADGRLADPPIALCEVQGYIFAAFVEVAQLAEMLGQQSLATNLRQSAQALQQRFEERFWLDDLGTYALGLDRDKELCRVKTSNAGHCLFSGIASRQRAARLAQTLLDESMFSGWGIRTVATSEVRYNPMSYHNGSVWPHDNSLIACGLARYGLQKEAAKILTALFDASLFMDLRRMPELFCGFPRRPGEGPTLYPVACSPQSWAAGSVFFTLQACLGLTIDAPGGQIRFNRPMLPEALEEVTISNLAVADGKVDLFIERHPHDVSISILRRSGDVELVIVK
jgi:glycogen debranching enzyme